MSGDRPELDGFYEMGGLRIIRSDDIGAYNIESMEEAEKIRRKINDWLGMYRLDVLLLKIHDDLLDNKFKIFNNFVLSLVKFVLLNSTMHSEIKTITDEKS